MTNSSPVATSPPAFEARGLGRRFGRRWALAHVDLTVAPGESLLLAGANGSGKTTLLRIAAGLSTPSAGTVRIFGHDPEKERLTCRRLLTLVGHRSYLYDRLTALETLRIWSRLTGAGGTDAELLALLAEVELEPHAHRQVGEFSAGMRKRLTLLRTRLERPRLLLLDEPLAALDAAGKQLVERWIRREREGGAAVIVASHALERMSRICERGLLLEAGQAVWEGPAAELPRQAGETQ